MSLTPHPDSFAAKATLTSGGKTVHFFSLAALTEYDLTKLPFSLRILLENLLRCEDGRTVTADDIRFLAQWDAKAIPSREIAYMPARVLMQDLYRGSGRSSTWRRCAMRCARWGAIRRRSTRCSRRSW